MPLPDFVVVGAQKAGTTSLYRMLRKHPQIHMPGTKELHFFDVHWDRGVQWYSQQFTPGRWQWRRGEATPYYLYRTVVRERMLEVLPKARIVVILRNPVDRAYSHYWHDLRRFELERHDREVFPTFETAVAFERPYLLGHLIGRDGPELWKEAAGRRGTYIRRGEYIDQVEPFIESYGRERVHIMLLEDLVAERERTLRELFGFLHVLKRPARTIEDTHANRYRRPAGDGRMEPTAYVPMDPATREILAEHFKPFTERLETLLGRDLTHWR
ncbi:MAG TPA: sulfotransferase [Actinomycetes bacterium]|nr:sulfotransferase [Actinomycetes bacterium]